MAEKFPISKRVLRTLSRDQLIELQHIVQELIRSSRQEKQQNGERLEEKDAGNKTYRLVVIRCGKQGCKCAKEAGHGPYWYAYWSERGKTRSEYIGKKLPQKLRNKST